ncbi:MAG TPA: FTR1 family protein [Gemmatimonadales bacterium]|nr:FTR1 family protein [Gemmatimonadales bacterium]
MLCLSLPPVLAGQGEDSLAVARRVVAAASLAAKEYADGVAPGGGRVTAPQEVAEAEQFLDAALLDAPNLPTAARAGADSGLRALRVDVGRAAPPDSVAKRVAVLVQRIAAAAGGPLDAFPSAPPSLARGAAVYQTQCVQCHGATGRGDGPKARHLVGPPAADLTDLGDVSPVDMYRKIAIGVAGTGMPQYAEALASDDRWALTEYVLTLGADPGRVREGEGVYAAHCASCHGARGRGDGPLATGLSVAPPALADLAIQARFSDSDLVALTRDGRPGTPMPGFARELDQGALRDLVAFLRVLPAAERQGPGQASPTTAAFVAVRRELDSAVAAGSPKLALDAYMSFEQVESDVRARNAALASELEDAFAALRTRAGAGAGPDELAAIRGRILSALERAERLVADRPSRANLFTESFVLLVREGFEAILVVAALMAFLNKAGAAERRRDVATGAWVAVAASVATAAVVEALFTVTPGQREALEGGTMLLAAAVLFYVSYWLLSKIEVAKWNAFMKSRMEDALSKGSRWALASVAFLAVYREGFETILFYQALITSAGTAQGGTPAVVGGLVAGAVTLVFVYIAINRFGMRLPLKPFFAVTSAMLYYMAFVFAGRGIAELQEGGLVRTTVLEWAPRVPVIGVYPTAESLALQGLLVVLLVVAVVLLQRRVPAGAAGRPRSSA